MTMKRVTLIAAIVLVCGREAAPVGGTRNPPAGAGVQAVAAPPQNAIFVSTRQELVNALYSSFTTIQVADNAVIDLTGFEDLPLGEGVTLASGRGGLQRGALLYKGDFSGRSLFEVRGNNVRVRGLRLRGPSGSPEKNDGVAAIRVRTDKYRGLEVTDSELFNWTHAGVEVRGNYGSPGFVRMDPSQARQIYIARNYLHHNLRDDLGYGVVVSNGAYALIEGNVFDYNRHAVASDGKPYTGYIARFNYVQEGGHCQSAMLTCYYNQHFDVSGAEGDGYGGAAGEYYDISYNFVRGDQRYRQWKNRPVLLLRGDPRVGLYFYSNVVVHPEGGAIDTDDGGLSGYEGFKHLFVGPNSYHTDTSNSIATGEFDGDGRQDVFLATGASWFYSSSGSTEWRFLSPTTTRLTDLRFGDFNGDGRTDVFTQIGARWFYSAGGRQPWAPLSAIGFHPLASYRFGDFDGDGRTDVFRADGSYWYISRRGRDDWEVLKRSNYEVEDIRLGDFDGDGATDVFGLVNGAWSWARSGSGPWTRLNDPLPLTTDMDHLVFADFDGNGRTDIAQRARDNVRWLYAADGRGNWRVLRAFEGLDDFREPPNMRFADLDGRPGAEALTFAEDNNRFMSWSQRDGPSFSYRGGPMR